MNKAILFGLLISTISINASSNDLIGKTNNTANDLSIICLDGTCGFPLPGIPIPQSTSKSTISKIWTGAGNSAISLTDSIPANPAFCNNSGTYWLANDKDSELGIPSLNKNSQRMFEQLESAQINKLPVVIRVHSSICINNGPVIQGITVFSE